MNNDRWEFVASLLEDKFNIPRETIDLVASIDVLKMCVSGSSNKSISRFLDISEQSVEDTVQKYLGFPGWNNDLDLNIYQVGKNLDKYRYMNLETFTNEVKAVSPYYTDDVIEEMYLACITLQNIENKIEKDWK